VPREKAMQTTGADIAWLAEAAETGKPFEGDLRRTVSDARMILGMMIVGSHQIEDPLKRRAYSPGTRPTDEVAAYAEAERALRALRGVTKLVLNSRAEVFKTLLEFRVLLGKIERGAIESHMGEERGRIGRKLAEGYRLELFQRFFRQLDVVVKERVPAP
jgi:hypothetical protein